MYEIKLTYLKRLVPTFCKIYLNCMIQSINKSCLNLLRKLISYASHEQLDRIVQMNVSEETPATTTTTTATTTPLSVEKTSISTLLIELVSKILQEDGNYESIFTGLSISSDLFKKCSPFILEEFTRLGVANLISQLAAQSAAELVCLAFILLYTLLRDYVNKSNRKRDKKVLNFILFNWLK